jgi:hypothetical protein
MALRYAGLEREIELGQAALRTPSFQQLRKTLGWDATTVDGGK